MPGSRFFEVATSKSKRSYDEFILLLIIDSFAFLKYLYLVMKSPKPSAIFAVVEQLEFKTCDLRL